jgi:non-specific serine/threonine protein kinase
LAGLRNPEGLTNTARSKDLRGTLRNYQQIGADWLWFLSGLGLGACLADDMGLGKTIQVLSLLLALKQGRRRGAKPSLLVLPASLLANWKAEIARFAPTLNAAFIHPSETEAATLAGLAAKPNEALAGTDIVLTTYAMLPRNKWLLDIHWQLVILDEAQAVKNPAAQQTKTVKQLRADARIALTGTPVENRLADLWSLFDFLCPGLLGSAARFKKFVKGLEAREHDRYAPLRKLVGPYVLRRLKTDKRIIADLPDKTEMKAFCGLTKKQAALYARSVQELAAALEGRDGIQRRGLVLSFLMRFKQICNHPSQFLGDGGYEPGNSGKFDRLRTICEEIVSRQEKVLVFTQFREMTDPIAAFLGDVFGREGLVLHGGTAVKKRRTLIDRFQQEDGPPFFVLSLKAGGTGLNLTAASHVIHFDRWWNPAVENQATDRAFRIGQHRNVVVHKFICRGTIEEKIDALIEEKTNLADDILEAGAESMLTEMSDAQLLNVVALDIDRAQI